MRNVVRWLVVLAIVLAVIGLMTYARGPEHRRGDDVGAVGGSGVAALRS